MNWHLNNEFWGNTTQSYLILFAIAYGGALLLWALANFIGWRIQKINRGRNLPALLLAQGFRAAKTSLLFFTLLCAFSQRLQWSENAYGWFQWGFVTFLTIQVIVSITQAFVGWEKRFTNDDLADHGAAQTSFKMMLFFGRLFIYTLGLLVIIDNVPGVEITALVASLGIGGIAVALALQNILSDIFASLTITLDKPFLLGDFIIVEDHLGVVENIGLKTTRIRSLSGEQLVFSNNDLLTSRIRNFKRMEERRVSFGLQVTYDTPVEKLKKVPGEAQKIIEALPDTRFDRAHFKEHSDHSLDFEIVYYVLGADYNLYMDRQQAINLALHEFFKAEGIEFAFPTRTLYLKPDDIASFGAREKPSKSQDS